MRKIRQIFKKLKNNGSSTIMVIVSMAFIGIVAGALLSAAGYAYKLRMQDLNARDNFYYLEQSMNEIYAGVGSETVKNMQEAYVYTVEHMTKYDIDTQTYKTISDNEARTMFKDKFMDNLSSNPVFSQADVSNYLSKFISDSTVKLDSTKLYIDRTDPDKITIKNVTLTRTVKYDKSIANGDYTQTISTDIEIGNPDFDVVFNQTSGDSMNIFGFCMVADMGIEISEAQPVTIAGNIYAAADYYNKKYDESAFDTSVDDADKVFEKTYGSGEDAVNFKYKHGNVTSKTYTSSDNNTLYNAVGTLTDPTVVGQFEYYDGVNKRSMYSGLYIDRTDVSILADMIVVPGSIAVMDTGSLSIYGKQGHSTSEAEVWADNVILGGYSSKIPKLDSSKNPVTDEKGNATYNFIGSSANVRADMYIKDDTELNATASSFSLRGKYYGYGDSTSKDSRTFVPTVDAANFQTGFLKDDGTYSVENRGHYNSSAIIVNGERSTIDLSNTNIIYLAGRSYIELSKNVTSEDFDEVDGTTTNSFVNKQTVEFVPQANNFSTTDNTTDTLFMRDYKTGESLTIKSNQIAYIPVQYTGIPTPARDLLDMIDLHDAAGNLYYDADLHPALRGSDLFDEYFPSVRFLDKSGKYAIPCIMQEVSGKKYYYYDFQRAYNMIKNAAGVLGAGVIDSADFVAKYPTAEDYAAAFIVDYVKELNDPNSVIAEYLTDIRDYEGFEAGDIILPTTLNPDTHIYSSGAITSKQGTTFDVALNNDADISTLFTTQNFIDVASGLPTDYSDEFEKEYNYVKWNLGHIYDANEMTYIDELVADDDYGEASITPINKFLNYDKLNTTKKLDLTSGYYVVYSDTDVNVTGSGVLKGMIITKGDVTFAPGVTGFEGLIVAGGKVYVTNDLQTITASSEICRSVLRECQLSADEDCQRLLELFKGYEGSAVEELSDSTTKKTIDTIDYTDVVRFNNWMKNVE